MRHWSPWGGAGGCGAGGSCAWVSGSADAGGDTGCLGGRQRRSSLVLVPELRPTGGIGGGPACGAPEGCRAFPPRLFLTFAWPLWGARRGARRDTLSHPAEPRALLSTHLCVPAVCAGTQVCGLSPRRAVLTCFSWSSLPAHAPVCTHPRTAVTREPKMRNLVIVERTPETQVQPCRCNLGCRDHAP